MALGLGLLLREMGVITVPSFLAGLRRRFSDSILCVQNHIYEHM